VAPMHGFRHRFKTVGMEAGISTRVLDAIQGHAARTAGDSYGDVTVKAMAMAMEKVPRVVL
jgi:site-specific recombinase XerD